MNRSEKDAYDAVRDEVLTGVDWRWTGNRVTVLGMHPSILLCFPLILITQLEMEAIVFTGVYAAFLGFLKTRQQSPMEFAAYCTNRYIRRGRWPTK